jgi:hypothetical protein
MRNFSSSSNVCLINSCYARKRQAFSRDGCCILNGAEAIEPGIIKDEVESYSYQSNEGCDSRFCVEKKRSVPTPLFIGAAKV